MRNTAQQCVVIAVAAMICTVLLASGSAWASDGRAQQWHESYGLHISSAISWSIAATHNIDDYLDLNFSVLHGSSMYSINRAMDRRLRWSLAVYDPNDTSLPFGWSNESGYLYQDERWRLEFESMAAAYTIIRNTGGPGTFVTTNLMGIDSDPSPLYGGNDYTGPLPGDYGSADREVRYRRYVQDMIDICDPDMLLNGLYPFGASSDTFDDRWYAECMIVREKALAADIPYWIHLQAFSQADLGRRVPSDSDVRYEQFAAMTLGYKGFNYWTYNLSATHGGYYIASFFDMSTGAKTPFYYSVQDTCLEANTLGQSLKYLTSSDVGYVVGTGGVLPDGMTAWNSSMDPYITGISCTSDSSVDVLVGYLVDDNAETYIMICNTNHGKDLDGGATAETIRIDLDFLSSGITSLQRMNRNTGEVEPVSLVSDGGSAYHLDLTLPGGTAELLKFNTGANFQWSVNPGFDTEPMAVDLNGDGTVNLLDFAVMEEQWLESEGWYY